MTDDQATFLSTHPRLVEDLRSILSIHVNNRADVPAILRMLLLAIRTHTQNTGCPFDFTDLLTSVHAIQHDGVNINDEK